MTPATLALIVTCLSPGITDGDSLRCEGERVRLFGLDAPERHHSGGPASTRALADLTRGQRVTCTEAGPRSWGRLVARCTLPDGRDLTCEMIRAGQGVEWFRYSRGVYKNCARR